MVTNSSTVSVDDLAQIKADLTLIKNILMDEGKLTEWALRQLDAARDVPESQCISHEKVGEMLKGE